MYFGVQVSISESLDRLIVQTFTTDHGWIGNDSVYYVLRRNNPCNTMSRRRCEGLVYKV